MTTTNEPNDFTTNPIHNLYEQETSQSQGNGSSVPAVGQRFATDIASLEEKTRRVMAENGLQCAKLTKKLLESWWTDGFGGTDEFFRLRFQTTGADGVIPMALPSDRRGGVKWPMWRTQQDLDTLRQSARILVDSNSYAKGLMKNLINYVINKGFTYKAMPNNSLSKQFREEHGEELRGLAEKVQWVMNRFLQHNYFNTLIDPFDDETSVSCTREKEMFRRVYRDGEGVLRFFFHESSNEELGGMTTVRWVDPECIRNPPGAIMNDGWTLGRQHHMDPVDYERPKNWCIYNHEGLTRMRDGRPLSRENGQHYEIVPAAEIIQIKHMDEDAEIVRGTPVFSYEIAAALRRASRIQKNLSETAAERARWAEIWKHLTGTQAQVQTLAQGLSAINGSSNGGPLSQGTNQFPYGMSGGGITRRVSAGMEPVAPPGSTGVNEHLEAVQGDLRQACSGVTAPEYMAGSTNDANYATASEAGVPFVRNGESEQEHFKAACLRCVWKAIRWAIRCGKLPKQVMELIQIQVEAVQIHKNNEAELTAKNRTMNEFGIKSPDRWALEDGLDPEVEDALFKKVGRQFGVPLAKPGVGVPGQDQASSGDVQTDQQLGDLTKVHNNTGPQAQL